MADEQKTDTVEQTQNVDAKVTLSQSDLDNLINAKYAKGAEKATKGLLESLGVDSVDSLKNALLKQKELEDSSKTELQKALEVAKAKEDELINAKKELENMKQKSLITNLALQNNIKDIEYLEYEYSKQSSKDGFEIDSFINSLKDSKPYLFGDVKQTPPKTDATTKQGDPLSFQERVKLAKTQKELDALYDELK